MKRETKEPEVDKCGIFLCNPYTIITLSSHMSMRFESGVNEIWSTAQTVSYFSKKYSSGTSVSNPIYLEQMESR